MFDKTLLTEETRKNAKELLGLCKSAFIHAHASMGFDLMKSFDVVKVEGSFTYNKVKTLMKSYYSDLNCNAIIYIYNNSDDCWNSGSVSYAYVRDYGFELSSLTDYDIPHRWLGKYLHISWNGTPQCFFTKKEFESQRRKSHNISYIVMQSNDIKTAVSPAYRKGYGECDTKYGEYVFSEYMHLKNGEEESTNNIRYRVFEKNPNAEYYYEKIIYKVEGFPFTLRLNRNVMESSIEAGDIDKSGYIRKLKIEDYKRRVKELKTERAKKKVDGYDYSVMLNELRKRIEPLSERSTSVMKAYFDTVLKADGSRFEIKSPWNDVHSTLTIATPFHAYVLTDVVNCVLKSFRSFEYDCHNRNFNSVEAANTVYDNLISKINKADEQIETMLKWSREQMQ